MPGSTAEGAEEGVILAMLPRGQAKKSPILVQSVVSSAIEETRKLPSSMAMAMMSDAAEREKKRLSVAGIGRGVCWRIVMSEFG